MKRLIKSMSHALRGIRQVIKTEKNFQIHILATIFVVLVGILLEWPLIKWAILVVTIVIVLSAEMVNTAIEYSWNHLEPNHHPMVGKIKDIMAGSVFIIAIGAIIVGVLLVLK